jgi:hypothetical protein
MKILTLLYKKNLYKKNKYQMAQSREYSSKSAVSIQQFLSQSWPAVSTKSTIKSVQFPDNVIQQPKQNLNKNPTKGNIFSETSKLKHYLRSNSDPSILDEDFQKFDSLKDKNASFHYEKPIAREILGSREEAEFQKKSEISTLKEEIKQARLELNKLSEEHEKKVDEKLRAIQKKKRKMSLLIDW